MQSGENTGKVKIGGNSQIYLKPALKRHLSMCVSCGACADSCFFYRRDPASFNIPAYKVNGSLRKYIRRKGRLGREELDNMKNLLWGHCVLCGRCYCPMGIDIPSLLARARSLLRERGEYEHYEEGSLGVREINP